LRELNFVENDLTAKIDFAKKSKRRTAKLNPANIFTLQVDKKIQLVGTTDARFFKHSF